MISLPIRFSALAWERTWYALQTRYRFERKVVRQLESKSVETFAPVRSEIHHWSDRQKVVSVPLFSGYVFVHLQASLASRLAVLRTEGVISFVNLRGAPIAIPGKQIEDLRQLLSHKVPCFLHAFLKAGQKVRIRGGCLDGLEGILEESRQKTMVISLECIQRSVAIEIAGYELDPV